MLKILKFVFIVICTTNVWAMDNSQWLYDFSVFAGYGYFDYHGINDQLDTYHNMDGITYLPNTGFEFEYRSMNFIAKNQLSFSYNTYEKNNLRRAGKLTFWDAQYQLKAGYAILNNPYIRFFPFAGFLAQYQSIKADFNYIIQYYKCFFKYKHSYSNITLGILYGLSCELSLPLKINILKNIKVGFDVGWNIPLENKKWWIDNREIDYPEYAPESNFRYFWDLKIIYHL